MGAPDLLLDECRGVDVARVDGEICAQSLRERELGVVDIDGHDIEPHRLGILHGHMPETADARDRHPIAGPCVRDLQPLVDRHAGAQDRGDVDEPDIGRQVTDIVGIGENIFGKTAIHRIAGILLGLAERFPSAEAMNTVPAGGVEPGDADTVALLHIGHAATHRDHMTDTLMAGNERWIGLDRPVPLGRVKVCMTNAGRRDLHQDLARARHRDLPRSPAVGQIRVRPQLSWSCSSWCSLQRRPRGLAAAWVSRVKRGRGPSRRS